MTEFPSPQDTDDVEATDVEATDIEVVAVEAADGDVTEVEVVDLEVTDGDVTDVEVTDVEIVDEPVAESAYDRPGRWYIVHTFAGHEQKVIGALTNIIKSRELADQIYEIYMPEEDVTEFKGGKKATVSKRMFPSYLLVRCEPDPEIFYVIGSTPGVTGFVGAEKTKPTALTRREVDNIIRPHVEGAEPAVVKRRTPTHEFEVNDTVQIKTGPFATFSGHVADINDDQLKVKVLVDIFGRETPVELDFAQVSKL